MKHTSRGDISIYIAITTAIIMLGSATLLSLILARQISLTKNIIASERAFFAANAGQEHAYYLLAIHPDPDPTVNVSGRVEYKMANGSTLQASYTGEMKLINGLACGDTEGVFPANGGTSRRLAIGTPGCN